MAPTPPNLNNLTAPGAAALPDGLQQPHRPEHAAHHFGGHHVPPYPGAVPAPAPAPAAGGVHHARPQQHAERDAYPDTYPGQYEFAVNPPVHRKPPPPVPPYPGTEHLYNTYPSEAVVVKEGGMPPGGLAVPPGPGGPPVGPSGPGGAGGAAIVVRAEEALLVLLVLVLWVAAIALFFNRWGKIRMLEPYQPKFQQHRQSCALVDISGTTQHHRLSKLNLHTLGEPVMLTGPPGPAARAQLLRPRQNSVFVGASPTMLTALHNPPRKVKSAMDLQTLVLSEHEPALGPLGPIGATTSASVLPTCSPSMRRASHVPVGSVPLGAIRHHASFSHASFSEHQPSCSYHRFELRAPGGLPSGLASIPGPSTSGEQHRAERLTSMDRYSHGSNV
ncbi:uncharacterized protein LOC113217784 isoform X1 [Frankliniella occidentalis]|uniref:Uncharacterized protein LOC113217784 isoform X1 n=1 Tax=Frankliniella occidentalis TaxID=133901 RepID=A0A6J1TLI9_FRAOC|nr:uncharacterized protein LOC113217784 isoform X1 [Frankliniella occidentalis]